MKQVRLVPKKQKQQRSVGRQQLTIAAVGVIAIVGAVGYGATAYVSDINAAALGLEVKTEDVKAETVSTMAQVTEAGNRIDFNSIAERGESELVSLVQNRNDYANLLREFENVRPKQIGIKTLEVTGGSQNSSDAFGSSSEGLSIDVVAFAQTLRNVNEFVTGLNATTYFDSVQLTSAETEEEFTLEDARQGYVLYEFNLTGLFESLGTPNAWRYQHGDSGQTVAVGKIAENGVAGVPEPGYGAKSGSGSSSAKKKQPASALEQLSGSLGGAE